MIENISMNKVHKKLDTESDQEALLEKLLAAQDEDQEEYS
jgi:hypothetical protein